MISNLPYIQKGDTVSPFYQHNVAALSGAHVATPNQGRGLSSLLRGRGASNLYSACGQDRLGGRIFVHLELRRGGIQPDHLTSNDKELKNDRA